MQFNQVQFGQVQRVEQSRLEPVNLGLPKVSKLINVFDPDDYIVKELVIRAVDDYYYNENNRYPNIPKNINGAIAVLDRIIVNSCLMTIKKDTTLNLCFKFYINPEKYPGILTPNSSSSIPNVNPMVNQKTEVALRNEEVPIPEVEYLVLPVEITIPAGDYTSQQLITTMESAFNAQYDKPIKIYHSKGENVYNYVNTGVNDYSEFYKFRLKVNLSLVNQKMVWNFTLWAQSSAALVAMRPEFRATNSIGLMIRNDTKGYTTYLYSQMSYHDIYCSGDRWFLEKLGLVPDIASKTQIKIRPNDATATLFTSSQKAPTMSVHSMPGFNDTTSYAGLTFQQQELLQVTCPNLMDVKLGNNLLVYIENLDNISGATMDCQQTSDKLFHIMNLKMYSYGSIVEEFPDKAISIMQNGLSNTIRLRFTDEYGEVVNTRDLNYTAFFRVYSKNTKVYK